MAYKDLKRVLDQVRPTPEQEETMLETLLREQEEGMRKPMKKSRIISRFAAVAAAAALAVTTCAFAVVTGLDQRLLSYFGGEAEQETLLSPAAAVVDQKIKDQGSTLHVRQVIADRYSAVILMDFTAPEGMALDGDYYALGEKLRGKAPDGTELSAWGAGWTLLEDEDPGDNHISLLFHVDFLDRDFDALGTALTLDFKGLYGDNLEEDCLVQGHWKCKVTLPWEDPGRYVTPDAPIEVDGNRVTLTSLYLSPISFTWELGEGEDDLETLGRSDFFRSREDWSELISLQMEDGREVPPGEVKYLHTQYKTDIFDVDRGRYCFRLPEIIDPGAVTLVTLFGQNFEMTE